MLRLAHRLLRGSVLSAMIPPFFLDCVIAIGLSISQQGAPTRVQWQASGFLVGQAVEEQKGQYRIFAVTCAHVINNLRDAVNQAKRHARSRTFVTPLARFNPMPGSVAQEYPIHLDKFKTDEATDVAVAEINVPVLKQRGISNLAFFPSDQAVADRAKANDLGLSEGDGVYVLGFPLGLVELGKHNYVIVRSGTIARIRDELNEEQPMFLIDSFSFPGNSGGPVISKPEPFAISGTKAHGTSYLIGMIHGYVPYEDIAVSEQTLRPRVIFEENSGLAEVIPIDYVNDLIETVVASAPKPTASSSPCKARSVAGSKRSASN